jgi:hypothetical protein
MISNNMDKIFSPSTTSHKKSTYHHTNQLKTEIAIIFNLVELANDL